MASGPRVILVQCEKSPVPGAGDRDERVPFCFGAELAPHASLEGVWIPWSLSHWIWQTLASNVVLWLIFGLWGGGCQGSLVPSAGVGVGKEERS